MAHLHLASEALARRDSTTALTEARLAAEIRPDDPVVQLFLGYTLFSAHHSAEAIEHLRAATAADPYYALPYYYTGQASELAHDTTGGRSWRTAPFSRTPADRTICARAPRRRTPYWAAA